MENPLIALAELLPLDTVVSDIKGRFFPVVGIGSSGVEVTVNFGSEEFLFKDFQ